MMSSGPQVAFPNTPCDAGLGKANTVVKVIIPKKLIENGLKEKVVRKDYDDNNNATGGHKADVPKSSTAYPKPHTRVDFDTKNLFVGGAKIIAVKIILRDPQLYFDSTGPITLTDVFSAPISQPQIFCGLKILPDELDEDESTGNPKRQVVKFYIMQSAPATTPYGYNIHLMAKDGVPDFDVPITIDPKITNNG